MPYTINGLTGNIDVTGNGGGGGGGGITTIIAQDGSFVTGANVDIQGLGYGDTPTVDTTVLDGVFYIENRTFYTPYVVDPSTVPGKRGTFTTIQAAINQALADGMTQNNPKLIEIRYATYIENLTLYDGLILEGIGCIETSNLPRIFGSHGTSAGELVVITIKNIELTNQSTSLDTITNNATILRLGLVDCTFSLPATATGAHFRVREVKCLNCIFSQDGWTKTLFIEVQGSFKLCNFGRAIITKMLSSAGTLFIENSEAIGQIRYIGLLRSNFCVFDARTPATLPIIEAGSEAGGVSLTGHCINPLVIGGSAGINNTATMTVAIIGMGRSAVGFASFSFPTNTNAAWMQGNVKPTRQVAAATTLLPNDNVLLVNTNATPITITLPSITQGMTYTVKDNTGNADVNPITLASTDPIDGITNYVINKAWGSATLIRYASNWRVIETAPNAIDLHVSSFIVNNVAGQGNNYTSVIDAYNDASFGQTVFVMEGSYIVEGLQLKDGVDIVAFQGESANPNVRLVGKMTADFEGTCTISGVRLETDSDFFLEIIGTDECNVNLRSAFLQCSDFDGILFTNSNASSLLTVGVCSGDIGAAGLTLFRASGAGEMLFSSVIIANTGLSDEPSTISSGTLRIKSAIFFFPIETSGTSGLGSLLMEVNTSSVPAKCLTIGGSGSNSIRHGTFNSLTETAITVNSTLNMQIAEIGSSNAVAIDGPGTLNHSGLNFFINSTITTANQNVLYEGPSKLIGSSNSGGTNFATVSNISNTASSNALIRALVGGTSGGDAIHQSSVIGGSTWSWGLDNSDADSWVLSQGTALGTNNAMRVSTAGLVSLPLQTSFSAYLTTTISDVTGDNTEYSIIFDTVAYNIGGAFNPATGIFTAPETGQYTFSLAVALTGGTAITQGNVKIVTTSMSYQNSLNIPATGPTAANAQVTHSFLLSAGDTAKFTVTALDSGGKVDDVLGLTGSNIRTYVSGRKIP